MHKYIFITAFLLIFTASLVGFSPKALASDEVSFSNDTDILLGNGIVLKVMAGSVCDQMVVGADSVTFTLSTNSSVDLRSYNRYMMSTSLSINSLDCNNGPTYSRMLLTGKTPTTDATITPISSSICPTQSGGGSGGGGGGGGSTTTTTTEPTTTTGQVTATVSNGGKTTLTTSDNATATVELPANAVSSSTDIKITVESKTNVTANEPVPSGKFMVGNYVYNFTATSGGASVTTFSKNLTLTFTYTDSQIAGFNEDTLKIYYWTGTQWLAMGGILDKVNNKIIVTTNHFTHFAIMGDTTTTTTMAKPSDYGLKEGDLIRAVGDIDIFIINQYGYKRLFLNPAIFNMYGHLGGWSAVKSVAPSTRDAFVTSNYYRYVDSPKVYFVEVTGGDTGTFHWVNMTGENFSAQGGKANAIFTINGSEFDWYPKGIDKTSL